MRIKEIILDKKEPTVYCESFVYEPSNVEEETFGSLFMVGRIRNVSENSFYLINLLASRIKREYYNLKYTSPYYAFEAAMKEGNKVLKENEERINWLGNLDFLIVATDGKKIYFSQIGKMKFFILRENEVIDLIKNLIEEKDVLFPFSTILQSAIKKDDVLVLTTSNIFSKEVLLNEGANLFPIDEEKIAKIINPEESGVSLVVETGETSTVIERLTPALSVLKPPVKIPQVNLPQKEKLKAGVNKGKEVIKEVANKGKSILGSKFKKIEGAIQERKEKMAPRITVEKMHYSNKFKMKFLKLLKHKGIVAIAISTLVLAFILGTAQYKKSQQLNLINQTLKEVKEKINESENYLVYGDKEKAIIALSKGSEALNNIKSNLKKTEVETLKKEIETKIAEISGRKILTNLNPIFEVKEEKTKSTSEAWQSSGMVLESKNIYLYSENSATLYKWNLDERITKTLKQKTKVLGGTLVDKKIFFLLAPTSVVINEREKTLPIEFPYENFTPTQISGYLNFLYILDSKEGEISKYNVSESKIDSPILWLKQRNLVKGATSFAIDGNIYVLYADGKIQKFTTGNLKAEFQPPNTYPKIKSAVRIYTSAENKYLYIADAGEKRIIVEDKKGNIVAEYQSESFENLKDVWANSSDNTIYVLANNKVFQIEIK